MAEFWEENFKAKQAMWGHRAAHSAYLARDYFVAAGVHEVLVPGFGYGRNARVLHEVGMNITGIEISSTAIDLARKYFGPETIIHHGSVTDMPFDEQQFEGVYCHALLHLLAGKERRKLIKDCYQQLADKGQMVFTVLAKEAHSYGKGQFVSKDRYEVHAGVKLYFYNQYSIEAEFTEVGLADLQLIQEDQAMYLVKCKKG